VNIAESDYVLLLLDPTRIYGADLPTSGGDVVDIDKDRNDDSGEIDLDLDELLDDNDESLEFEAPYDQNRYSEEVSKVLNLLVSNQRENRAVAICVTKSDLLGVIRDPWIIIKMYFGNLMYNQLISYNSRLKMEAFCVSSAGFLDNEGEIGPNFDFQTGEIIDKERWQPENVESPFFWLFGLEEQMRLAKGSNSFMSLLIGKNDGLKLHKHYYIRKKIK